MTTPKQAIAFPEVAVIRKGNPKTAAGVGRDLNDRFRVAFYPGVDASILDTFQKAYGDLPKRIKAFIPFPHVWDAFTSYNEAHNAGRMIAQADHQHYLMRRHPLTGAYEIRDGEPFTPFQPGDKITYTRGDKTYELPLKTTNRLRLVIPEIVATGRLVTFTFKSTALYDRFNLETQLGALQALANTLNRGNAAGIPFWLYRAEREITWNKPDGSASRIKKWLVQLEPDPEWVQAAFKRMSQFALTGSQAPVLPEAVAEPLVFEEDPGVEDEDDEDESGVFETTARPVPPAPQPIRIPAPAASTLPKTLPPTPEKTDPTPREKYFAYATTVANLSQGGAQIHLDTFNGIYLDALQALQAEQGERPEPPVHETIDLKTYWHAVYNVPPRWSAKGGGDLLKQYNNDPTLAYADLMEKKAQDQISPA